MKCEICDEQTATMWVQPCRRTLTWDGHISLVDRKPIVSCSDCGPQLGYKILAPLTSVQCHG